jgi:hypothetical protein
MSMWMAGSLAGDGHSTSYWMRWRIEVATNDRGLQMSSYALDAKLGNPQRSTKRGDVAARKQCLELVAQGLRLSSVR